MTAPRVLPGLQGSVVWAISPFDAAAPFRVVEHDGTETRYMTGGDLGDAILGRRVSPEFELAVSAKLRPVLLLQDRPARRFNDFAALPLTRLQKFDAADQEVIRNGEEPSLFYLGHNKKKYGMDKEYAVQLGGLHRVHISAIVGKPAGAVDLLEFRTVCERLARIADLDLSNLIVREAAAFVKKLTESPGP